MSDAIKYNFVAALWLASTSISTILWLVCGIVAVISLAAYTVTR